MKILVVGGVAVGGCEFYSTIEVFSLEFFSLSRLPGNSDSSSFTVFLSVSFCVTANPN